MKRPRPAFQPWLPRGARESPETASPMTRLAANDKLFGDQEAGWTQLQTR